MLYRSRPSRFCITALWTARMDSPRTTFPMNVALSGVHPNDLAMFSACSRANSSIALFLVSGFMPRFIRSLLRRMWLLAKYDVLGISCSVYSCRLCNESDFPRRVRSRCIIMDCARTGTVGSRPSSNSSGGWMPSTAALPATCPASILLWRRGGLRIASMPPPPLLLLLLFRPLPFSSSLPPVPAVWATLRWDAARVMRRSDRLPIRRAMAPMLELRLRSDLSFAGSLLPSSRRFDRPGMKSSNLLSRPELFCRCNDFVRSSSSSSSSLALLLLPRSARTRRFMP
mmetsp:Transcript_8019/g.23043  ORF Transcript_8019/g.23043 Transcript_8019/m.23043 type:complete len:285 (+) Transcript_8019:389-1243(+)